MSYLIGVNKAGNTILRPECIKLWPELAFLSGQEMLAIILSYDYYSLYRQYSQDERERRARIHVFKGEREGLFKEPKIIKASMMYRSLQYDPRREQIIVYNRKLENCVHTLENLDDNDHDQTKKLLATIKEFRKAIAELEAEINHEDEVGATETDEKLQLSFLERLTSNKERFLEVTKPKTK
jgi:hypothetical protein